MKSCHVGIMCLSASEKKKKTHAAWMAFVQVSDLSNRAVPHLHVGSANDSWCPNSEFNGVRSVFQPGCAAPTRGSLQSSNGRHYLPSTLRTSSAVFNHSEHRDLVCSQLALCRLPQNASATKTNTIYVSDAIGNRVRAITAVCSKVCENGGECVAPETCRCVCVCFARKCAVSSKFSCRILVYTNAISLLLPCTTFFSSCPEGWEGDDCSLPVCSSPCAARHICTSPDTCTCLPGWEGDGCLTPQCVQECEHGGVCVAPDTCSCPHGWFDANCTTPVCSQTCGNGGNCTAPDTCACSADWQGFDCRTPYCTQVCASVQHKNISSAVAFKALPTAYRLLGEPILHSQIGRNA